jgi:hypothetical protein
MLGIFCPPAVTLRSASPSARGGPRPRIDDAHACDQTRTRISSSASRVGMTRSPNGSPAIYETQALRLGGVEQIASDPPGAIDRAGLLEASALLYMASDNPATSAWLERELGSVLQQGRPVIPIVLADVVRPACPSLFTPLNGWTSGRLSRGVAGGVRRPARAFPERKGFSRRGRNLEGIRLRELRRRGSSFFMD